jgi:hypothetical protein
MLRLARGKMPRYTTNAWGALLFAVRADKAWRR